MKIYTVEALGWGDSEDEFVAVGQYSTLAKAKAKVKELTEQWVAENGDTDGLELQITDWELDA
jgi:hypothetical protein